MLHGNGADAQLFSQDPFRGKLASIGQKALYNVLPHLTVQLQIGRLALMSMDDVFHLVI